MEQDEILRCALGRAKAALIDMDGVLYDTMRYHTLAWQRMMAEMGVMVPRDEFYLYEGMTGAATIRLLWRRAWGCEPPEERIRAMYARKGRYFEQMGCKPPLEGADRMLRALADMGLERVLVTGSQQQTILDSIAADYPGAFRTGMRVTARDVTAGKPAPEPYLKGLALAGVEPQEAIVVENAPLGVRAGKAAGIFTVAVTTGPIPRRAFEEEHADVIYDSMPAFAAALKTFADFSNDLKVKKR